MNEGTRQFCEDLLDDIRSKLHFYPEAKEYIDNGNKIEVVISTKDLINIKAVDK